MSQITFEAAVRRADKDYDKEKRSPRAYEFSNGRVFTEDPSKQAYAYATNTDGQ